MGFQSISFDLVKVLLCIVGVIMTFFTVIDLTYFLSTVNVQLKVPPSKDPWLYSSWALLVNMALISLFIMQHSIMAMEKVKNAFAYKGFQVVFRSIYVITTAGALSYLMKNWHPIPYVILWKFNLLYRPVWWIYLSVHLVAWIIIYVASICTDVTELLGIKQVYYSIVNLPDPNRRKSYQLRRLNAHMRHPSFLAFLLIFWFYPVMTLDRILLATILTLYMYIAWNTDGEDYFYQKTQYQRKYQELQHLHRY